MHFTDKTYVVAIWFVAGDEKDWMAHLSRPMDGPLDRFELEYRFRYYAGTDDPFDETDDKSWYEGVAEKPEAEAEAALDSMARLIRDEWGARRLHKIRVHGDGFKAYRKLRAAPFAHIQVGERPVKVTGKGGQA